MPSTRGSMSAPLHLDVGIHGSCDAPNKMGPVLQCTLDEVPLNLLDKMYEQEPMEIAKQDRTRAWVIADTEARIEAEVLSSPRTLSASSTPPPADRDSHPSSAAGIYDGKNVEGERSNTEDGQQSCRINLKADDDDASSCLSSEMDPANEEMDLDFYYGPRPVDDVTAIEEDEMSLQVAIALQQLERLQAYSSDPQVKSLFVRWTIHNWAVQGPFNIHAYQDTLASFFAARACSEEINSEAAEGKSGETSGLNKDACVDAAIDDLHGQASATGDAMAGPDEECQREIDAAREMQVRQNDEASAGRWSAWSAKEGVTSSMVRRVRCKQRWPLSRPLVKVDDVPLGHISGAGSVIVASHAPPAVNCKQEGQDEHECYGDVDKDIADNFADDILAGLEESVGQKRARHGERGRCDEVQEPRVKVQACDRSTTASPGDSDCSTVAAKSLPPSPERPPRTSGKLVPPIGATIPPLDHSRQEAGFHR